jgi:hypothetical protein
VFQTHSPRAGRALLLPLLDCVGHVENLGPDQHRTLAQTLRDFTCETARRAEFTSATSSPETTRIVPSTAFVQCLCLLFPAFIQLVVVVATAPGASAAPSAMCTSSATVASGRTRSITSFAGAFNTYVMAVHSKRSTAVLTSVGRVG